MSRFRLSVFLDSILASKSKTFLGFCFFFLAGVVLASVLNRRFDFVYFYFVWLTLGGWLIIFFLEDILSTFKKQPTTNVNRELKIVRLILCGLLFASLGFARYNFAILQKRPDNINFYNGKTITLEGFIAEEPDIREDKAIYILRTTSVRVEEENLAIKGNVYLSLNPQPRYAYGDILSLSCALKDPREINPQFAMYLATKNISSVCWSPEIGTVMSGGNKIKGSIIRLKNIVDQRLRRLWHEPYASFMAGILYGYRGGLGKAGEIFQKTGTTHIIAVSGQNISIVANFLLAVFIFCRIPRKKSFYLICFGIIFFVIFTGASSSAVRAGVMAILMLLARQIGRRATGLNLLIFAAVVLAWHNPFILIWDVGFQLSFLSTLGIMLFSPILNFYCKKIPEKLVVKEALITSASATILTLPVILYSFGQISLVSILVNIFILWLIPILMFAGFMSVLVGLFYFPLGDLLAWLPWFGMKYIFTVVKFFANLKFSSLNFQLPLWTVLVMYLIIFYSTRRLSRVINSSLPFRSV